MNKLIFFSSLTASWSISTAPLRSEQLLEPLSISMGSRKYRLMVSNVAMPYISPGHHIPYMLVAGGYDISTSIGPLAEDIGHEEHSHTDVGNNTCEKYLI